LAIVDEPRSRFERVAVVPGFYRAGRGEVRLICVDCCDAPAEGQIPGFRSLLLGRRRGVVAQGIPP
jgi:hypothetical protein